MRVHHRKHIKKLCFTWMNIFCAYCEIRRQEYTIMSLCQTLAAAKRQPSRLLLPQWNNQWGILTWGIMQASEEWPLWCEHDAILERLGCKCKWFICVQLQIHICFSMVSFRNIINCRHVYFHTYGSMIWYVLTSICIESKQQLSIPNWVSLTCWSKFNMSQWPHSASPV